MHYLLVKVVIIVVLNIAVGRYQPPPPVPLLLDKGQPATQAYPPLPKGRPATQDAGGR